MKATKVQKLSSLVGARSYCDKTGDTEWFYKHGEEMVKIIDSLPSGSGIDKRNYLNHDESTTEKIVIHSEYHAMGDNGAYDGCIDYIVVVTPSLQFGFNVKIHGNFSSIKNALGIKDYLTEIYSKALEAE